MRCSKSHLRPALGALLLFTLTGAAGTWLVLHAEHLRAREEREAASQAAAGAAVSLEQEIAGSMAATYALAAIVRQHGRIDQFEDLAAQMLTLYGHASALQLAPGGVIRQVYPRAGNEQAIGHDLLADPDRRFQAAEAIRTRRLGVAGPFELRQGGVGLVGRLPIFVPDGPSRDGERFWGFATALVRLGDLVASSRLGQLATAGYEWELSRPGDGGGPWLRFAGSGADRPRDPVTWTVTVPNGEWRLALTPAGGWRAGRGLLLRELLVLLLATCVAGLAFAVLRQPAVLRREVEARTRDLAEANARLAADVRERERAELALSAETERLAVTLRSIGDAVIATDVAGRITLFNPVAEQLTGWSGGQAVGRDVHEVLEVVLEDGAPGPRTHPVDRVLSDGPAGAVDAALVARDGLERLIAARGAPIRDADGRVTGVVLVLRDRTDERRLEEHLRQSQRLESVGRLAGGVAHDFNNLLTVILACADAAKADLGEHGRLDPQLIDDIRDAGQRAAGLTRQLLTFARKQVIAPVPLDLNDVVGGSEKLLRRVLGEDVEIVTVLGASPSTVRCDPGQIEQVILNLAVNARDAMPGGGRLTLETGNTVVSGEWAAAHPGMRPGPHVRLRIRDSGSGMSPSVKERVFEPFFTTKPIGKGTGLGLATVYGIVKQGEGCIEVSSDLGQGSTFDIHLPLCEAGRSTAPGEPPPPVARGDETILLVEDDPQVRQVTARSLCAGGYRVVAASSGAEALDLAARHPGSFDLLVSDVIMPGLDGRAVANALRSHHPALQVLFVSGYSSDVLATRGVLDPDVELLSKPFTASTLLARVRAILDAPAARGRRQPAA
ncbi:MAG TPA: ATP-binding protein [Anaeromyxobacteraceae bacterium]|nr:ATP-binding protein [Anaeromyxobacteraceae bacterium]